MTQELNEYEKQAQDFLDKTQTTIKIEFLKYGKHFEGDEVERDIYEVTLKNSKHSYKFNFGQSEANSEIRIQYPNIKHTVRDRSALKRAAKYNEQRGYEGERAETAIKRHIRQDETFGFRGVKLSQIYPPKAPNYYDILSCLQADCSDSLEDFCDNFGYDNDSKKVDKIYQAVQKETNNLHRLFSHEELEQLAEIQ